MKKTLLVIGALAVAALLIVHLAQRQLSVIWSIFGVQPEVAETLRASMDDKRKLARLDAERAATYRGEYDAVRALYNRLEILRSAQEEIARKYERLLFAIVACTILLLAAAYLVRKRREVRRLSKIKHFIERLSAGEQNLRVHERGRDAIATIARMIERTSDIIAADRRKLRYLENLSTWQEASRRHAHEIRTPLTAAQMEVDRLCRTIEEIAPAAAPTIHAHRQSIHEELDRLRNFTRSFTSFAALGDPRPVETRLGAFLEEFCATYSTAWPLTLAALVARDASLEIDRAMIRQILVNLCTNAALAGASTVTFTAGAAGRFATIDISDNGPGISAAVRDRLFEPYTTTRKVGEGMGLGLAISRKIALDHGGDLSMSVTGESGTIFRLALPEREGSAE